MAKYLMIVESPTKAKKIQHFLSKDYDVVPSFGHVLDLPEKELGVDIKKDFEPTYVVMDDKKDVLKDILLRAKKADMVYLAGDPDREGSGISMNIFNSLPKGTKAKRIKYHEITKKAIEEALANPIEINDEKDLYDAFETRRILDRVVGYKASYPVKQATGGPSAGRCQSAGLRIIVDREKEIQAFIPIVYWPITAELLTKDTEKIIAAIKVPDPLKIGTKEEAEKIIAVFKKGPVKVSKFEKKNANVNPYPPFTTSTLMQMAATNFGMSNKRTMDAAQKLFEMGKISYHRTDSVAISPDFVKEIVKYAKSNYDAKYIPLTPNTYTTKSKNAQEAHESIRCVNLNETSYSAGTPDEKKLYEAVWKRTVASQMSPATFIRSSAEFSAGTYTLSTSGSKMLFEGFRKVWDYSESEDRYLPELKIGDIVKVIEIKTEKKETQPPPRYSEASFTKTLEKEGIGRPSTYASICQTLLNRKYVELKSKAYHPTELGIRVIDFLVKTDFCFVDIKFTSLLEDKLDDIANSQANKLDVLTEFWTRLKSDLDKAKDTKKELQLTTFECPLCKKNKVEAFLVKKFSKWGEFFSCQNYSDKTIKCEYKANVGEDGKPVEKEKKPAPKKLGKKCPKCGKDLVIRVGKYGEFVGCSGFPACKGFYQMDGTPKVSSGKKFKKWGKKKTQGDDE